MSSVSPMLPDQIAAQILERYTMHKPKIGIVLGSGLGGLAAQLQNSISIPYHELPGFPSASVHGHAGVLSLGEIGGHGVVCLQGRAHGYEGSASHNIVKTYVRTLKRLGCEYFMAISACGSLREDVGPGELMLITDHINFQSSNPMMGPNDDDFGPRFFPIDNAYDKDMRELLHQSAQTEQIKLAEGVYFAVDGPNYETAAEIRAFKRLGADAVGMSTVPEVLVAVHCGMRVAVLAMITNYATGLSNHVHDHAAIVQKAEQSSDKVQRLVTRFIGSNSVF